MRKIILMIILLPLFGMSQAIVNSWLMNNNGEKASYWMPDGIPLPGTSWTYTPTNDSASVLEVCYRTDSVWVYSHGMVDNMGKYMNAIAVDSKNYVYRFPLVPLVPATKVVSAKGGSIGCLINGIPMFGLGDGKSWNGSANATAGPGVWNVEVYEGEGISLDTALSAHPEQTGAYHSHAKPRRLYQNVPSSQHSPIVGFAFDGYPVYGPFAYSTPTNTASAVTRMKSGYALRNITTRTTLPYGVTASQAGPAVSSTYPIGTYCEDYEWSASNGGDLDKYNGRFCITPEYPAGTYAYFVTIDATGTPQFPYYIGTEYYGQPDPVCNGAGPSTGLKFPTTGSPTCIFPTSLDEIKKEFSFDLFPNPSDGTFVISLEENAEMFSSVDVVNVMGQVISVTDLNSGKTNIRLPEGTGKGIYFVRLLGKQSQVYAIQKMIVE
jgi:hypothetical protein